MAALQTHDFYFSNVATNRGVSTSEYLAGAAVWLRGHVDNAEVRIRMRAGRFEQFLRDERYLTQFQAPMNFSGGAAHRGLRIMLEHTVLGVPPSARPADRPIYGYLSGSDEGGQVGQYGEVVLRLTDAIRRRATFMLGDSLDHALQHRVPAFTPCPITHPRTAALTPVDVLPAATLADACSRHRYAETQIYGGVRPGDVVEAVYTRGSQPSPTALALLRRSGVQWSVTVGVGP